MISLLACIDGSDHTASVCDYSAWLSRRLDAPVTLLHVEEDLAAPALPAVANGEAFHSAKASDGATNLLFTARQRLIQQGLMTSPKTMLRPQGLINTLRLLEQDTRLLIVGKRGDQTVGTGIGGQLESVVRAVNRPILVCPSTFKAPKRFTIAYDGKETTRQGILALTRTPLLAGMHGTLLRVGEERLEYRQQLEDLALLLRSAGCQVDISLTHGDVERILPRHLNEHRADLLIMGAYSHSSTWRFLRGSRTSHLMHHTDVPLLLLR